MRTETPKSIARVVSPAMGHMNMEKKWVFLSLVVSSLACIFLLATSFDVGLVSSLHNMFPSTNNDTEVPPPHHNPPPIPKFAYLISGSKGDLDRLWRTLHALYHPWNYYIVHLDLESPAEERMELAYRVRRHPLVGKIGNVLVNNRSNMVTYRGPTMVANTLHACAILLKKFQDWDWFINLSASDYPLVTQDDLLSVFTDVNRELNFIEHTSHLGWKANGRAMPLIVDPGLYQTTKADLLWVGPKRQLPTAFKLFTGSAWMVLSRAFVEHTVWGWDNLPRTLLMYYSNFVSSPEGYFQTVACNSPEFNSTVVNHDMHYISWDVPPKQHPHTLSLNDTERMLESCAAFARKFKRDDPVLDRIDSEFLGRKNGSFTPGGWCSGRPLCSEVGNVSDLRPGPGATRLRSLVSNLTSLPMFSQQQCI